MGKVLLLAVVVAGLCVGCATSIPLTSSLNDFVAMSTKPNKESISFSFQTNVLDSVFKPYDKDKTKQVEGHLGYKINPSGAFNRMVSEYLSNKFSSQNDTSPVKIIIDMKDFWIEQYSIDNTGKMVLVALAGGEINFNCVAHVKTEIVLTRNDEEIKKILSTSSENSFVHGVGTGTKTSNYYKGKESIEFVHAKNINNALNKTIMQLNAFLEQNNL